MTTSRRWSLQSFVLSLSLGVAACGPGSPAQSIGSSPRDTAATRAESAGIRRVVGSNDPTKDVDAVQDAVNSSREVRLAGTFDFGTDGQVILASDVAISGEFPGDGAIIKGGHSPFYSPLPAELPVEHPGPSISIRHLTFDHPHYAAIEIAYASAVRIGHNRIQTVVPLAVTGAPFHAQHGGILLGHTSPAPDIAPLVGAFTGPVAVRDNAIDMSGVTSSGYDPTKTMCQGIGMMRTWGVTAEISRNAISGCSRNGIEVTENYKQEGRGHVEISDNRIDLPAVGLAFPTSSTPNGIIAGWFSAAANAVSPEFNSQFRIAHNTVTGGGPASLAIFANTAGVMIADNRVAFGDTGKWGIMVTSPRGFLVRNEVSGKGQVAYFLYNYSALAPGVLPDGNTLQCNDATAFTASLADLVIQGTGNRVIGGGYDPPILAAPGNTFVDAACPAEQD